MKQLIILLTALSILSFVSPSEVDGDPYTACCGAEPVTLKVGQQKVFIPNVFTPNGDCINDIFLPFFEGSDISIKNFVIKNNNGDEVWSSEKTIPIDGRIFWHGKVSKDSTYAGLFHYEITFKVSDKQEISTKGSACSLVCKPNVAMEITNKNKCFFPFQYTKDSLILEFPREVEIDCFK
jgi:CHU_C Type IX secretion signal domain